METSRPRPYRPTPTEVQAARGRTIPDVIGPGLDFLFVGINPSLYSAAIGHHFGRPGNRFWPALHAAGLTPRLWSPFEDQDLLTLRMGITNLVARATARADELSDAELLAGAAELEKKAREYAPRVVAFLGVTSYRTALGLPRAGIGPQADALAASRVWVLPNPSGLNAHYQLADLGRLFAELRAALG